jgi:hypothetical protein
MSRHRSTPQVSSADCSGGCEKRLTWLRWRCAVQEIVAEWARQRFRLRVLERAGGAEIGSCLHLKWDALTLYGTNYPICDLNTVQ